MSKLQYVRSWRSSKDYGSAATKHGGGDPKQDATASSSAPKGVSKATPISRHESFTRTPISRH